MNRPLSNDTVDSVLHREGGRAKDLSAPSRTSPYEKYGFTFRVNRNGAFKNMGHDSTKCEINLLQEVQEKCSQPAQTQVLEDKGRYKHTISRYLESIPQYKNNSRINAS